MNAGQGTTHAIVQDMRARRFDVRSVVLSGLVGGALFLAVDMIGRAAAPGMSAWDTPRRIAWLLIGGDIEPSASTHQPGLLVLALTLHLMLALVYAMLIVLATRHFEPAPAILLGALFGLGLYVLNYHVLTPLFPAFADVRGPLAIAAHVAFGSGATATHVLLHPREREVDDATPEGSASELH